MRARMRLKPALGEFEIVLQAYTYFGRSEADLSIVLDESKPSTWKCVCLLFSA